ncbi:DUF6123 family protein [Halobacillus sp. A5]|uniref:DUF6123 family protein n=1 Tax=Halobacillus sp. A5 TaxID=2880263 RepID=UPI002111AD0A|nr:DUF6123 family protein [Halobacillus sp. A5]MCP3025903.1 DUF6123 family protein [Halobacillus sp. A5]
MKPSHSLAYYLEDLWSRGFKLSDEHVRFIYFGKNSTNTEDWKVILALQMTLKFQQKFDPSFYISVLELIADKGVTSKKTAYQTLEKRGFSNMETKRRTSH